MTKAVLQGCQRLARLLLGGLLLSASFLVGCADHHVLHPRRMPAGAKHSVQMVVVDDLRLRLEWVRPAMRGPLPVVIVHPEAGHQATHMRGVLNDLAGAGYLAVGVDYQRREGDRWRQSLFPWQNPSDPKRMIELVRADPDADPRRIGLLGFSQGGVLSLLIAAYDGGAAAVAAYYPVTDFENWLQAKNASLGRRLVFHVIRIGFRRASGARDDEEFHALLRRASPFWQAASIKIPVLLVHGDRDGSANIEESRRLAHRLAELKQPVQFVVMQGAGHVFNFRDRDQARAAWAVTLAFFDRHLRTGDKRISLRRELAPRRAGKAGAAMGASRRGGKGVCSASEWSGRRNSSLARSVFALKR